MHMAQNSSDIKDVVKGTFLHSFKKYQWQHTYCLALLFFFFNNMFQKPLCNNTHKAAFFFLFLMRYNIHPGKCTVDESMHLHPCNHCADQDGKYSRHS